MFNITNSYLARSIYAQWQYLLFIKIMWLGTDVLKTYWPGASLLEILEEDKS